MCFHCCITETLRMYPSLSSLPRNCVKEYRIPRTDHIIEKCAHVIIPAMALHMDEKYYEQPEQFIPERFNYDENSVDKGQVNRP